MSGKLTLRERARREDVIETMAVRIMHEQNVDRETARQVAESGLKLLWHKTRSKP